MQDFASGVTVPPHLLQSLSGSTPLLKGPGLICAQQPHELPPKPLGLFSQEQQSPSPHVPTSQEPRKLGVSCGIQHRVMHLD